MLKNKISVERQFNERLYQFLVPTDASYPEIFWVLDDIKRDLTERFQIIEKQQQESQNKEKQEA